MLSNTRLLIVITVIIGGVGLYNNIANHNRFREQQTNVAPRPTNSELLLSTKNTEIITSDVIYFQDINGQNITGFYASPKVENLDPGIVMVHDGRGLNDTVKDMAKELSKEGYQVFAVDLYKGETAVSSGEARRLAALTNQQESLVNMKAAVMFLENRKARRIGAVGWGFGGGQALQLSINKPLDAAVIYYGTPLITDRNNLASISRPVLGIFGEADTELPVSKVYEFQKTLNELKITNEIIIYPGEGHSFAEPAGNSWSAEATRDAWGKTLLFLKKTLKEQL